MNERFLIFYATPCADALELLTSAIRPTFPTAEIVRRELPPGFSSQYLQSLNVQHDDISFVACDVGLLPDLKRFINHLRSVQTDSSILVVYAGGPRELPEQIEWLGQTGVLSLSVGQEDFRGRLLEHIQKLKCARLKGTPPYEWQKRSKIIGSSTLFRRVLDLVPLAARSNAPTLITGESGTGKEVFARAIHYLSSRTDGTFFPLQCGAIAPDLFENELFGHESGAYTGAGSTKKGVVAETEKGTLFLDEIDSLKVDLQAKILRLIEEHEYRPVGSSTIKKADIRIVTATNADLMELIKRGTFREDLYYRIAVINLRLPPLRMRRDDIPVLAWFFLDKYSREARQTPPRLTESALNQLMTYDWPGNVRQLAHVMQQAIVYSNGGEIDSGSLDLPGKEAPFEMLAFKKAKSQMIDEFERSYVMNALLTTDWNVSEAARKAHLDRSAFCRKMHELGITRPNTGILKTTAEYQS